MPMIHIADTGRTADGSVATVAGEIDGAGVYLTNEVFLYRVAGLVSSATGEMVELEDCFHLDVVRVPLADVRARRLRVVTPAGSRLTPSTVD